MTFNPEEEAPLRTDESVANQDDENHHKGETPLRKITEKLVSEFPLEPMHLVYLGVFRRFFLMIFETKRVTTLKSKFYKEQLSVYALSLKAYFPSELAAPRPIEDWRQFKAAEWRRLGLYDGFLIFEFLSSDPLVPSRRELKKLRILIACAIRIPSDQNLLSQYRNEADILLRRFVLKSVSLFGQTFNVFNVHSLTHLIAETLLHGSLDNFSAWIYESYLGAIKYMLRKPGKTLEQIVCRLIEQRTLLSPEKCVSQETVLSQPHNSGPTFGLSDQFQKLSLPGMTFRVFSPCDTCFVTKSDEVFVLRNVVKSREGIFLVCNAFLEKVDFFSSPLSSQLLGICRVKRLSGLKKYPVDVIKNKAVLLPLNKTGVIKEPSPHWMDEIECVCLSMLH